MRRVATTPRGRRNKDREAKAAAPRQVSLRDVYVRACTEHNVHANSGVCTMLPSKADGLAASMLALDIGNNYIGDRGVVALLAVVERMPWLQRLVLTHNGLRNRGVECVCRVAAHHPGLVSIDISDNHISNGAAAALVALLHDNPRIVDVVLDNTAIDVEWRVRIRDALAANRDAAHDAALRSRNQAASSEDATQEFATSGEVATC